MICRRVCQAVARARTPKREMLAFLRSRMGAATASRWFTSLYVWHGVGVRENGNGKFGKADRQAPDLVGPCVLQWKIGVAMIMMSPPC